MSSIVVVERGIEKKASGRLQDCSSKARYLDRIKKLDFQELAFRKKLMEALELKRLSHEDISNH